MTYSYDRRHIASVKRVTDLPDDTYVRIGKLGDGFIVEFTASDGRSQASLVGGVEVEGADPECGDVYQVSLSEAPSGWGPFLYDIALEHAHPKGLIADRFEVSGAAIRVWNYYLKSRSDVKKRPLDPDCEAGTWEEAMDYAYYKAPRLIKEVESAGKLIRGKP